MLCWLGRLINIVKYSDIICIMFNRFFVLMIMGLKFFFSYLFIYRLDI